MYGYIYKITNKINGKIYIGQTIHKIQYRFREHCNGIKYLLKHRKNVSYLQKAILKYGKENFIIEEIDTAVSEEDMDNKEIFWIDKYNSTDRNIGYNITKGGEGGDTCSCYTWITNGFENKYIREDEIVPEGWKKGRIVVDGFKNSSTGKVWMNNGKEEELVEEELIEDYLNKGWTKGMLYRGDDWKENVAKSKQNMSKEKWVNIKEGIKRFYQEHPHFTNSGSFKKGQETHNKGKISVTNGINNKFIYETELNSFLKDNKDWRKGNTQTHKKRERKNNGKK